MYITEFISKYCKDIIKTKKEVSDYSLDGFSYDEIIEDADGSKVKIVMSGTKEIPITDILSMSREDFAKCYTSPVDLTTYDNYISSIIMLEGEDALNYIRQQINESRKKIENFTGYIDAI